MVIILTLKEILTNQDARKLFGKKEIEIILKQLNSIPLSQSEKNRLSRDIRPKLSIIKEFAQFKDEFDLKKNKSIKELLQKAVGTILNGELKDSINAILLFGSFANSTSTERSDIDVCVLFKKEISLKEATRFRIRISGQVSDKIDVQVFNILPAKIKKSIAENHRILYRSKEFDNLDFSIRYLKDEDYQIRMKNIFGAEA
jgi:predicted nucleotidyltransferase